ncbi:hypothetical protein NXF25_006906 [Crotalus adamanteus]|uniref:Uncharacterized protein n=1 Tax=Crotalus adamanteus TaxID=8729 RepID=A0AAW1C2Z1_CROAD
MLIWIMYPAMYRDLH